MTVSNTLTRGINDGSQVISKSETLAWGQALVIDESIPNSSTNLLVACAFAVAKLKSIFILSDAVVTLKTNSSGSPQETITLVASQPLVWSSGDTYFAVPFGGNVTALYVTNASGGSAQLQIRGIIDPT